MKKIGLALIATIMTGTAQAGPKFAKLHDPMFNHAGGALMFISEDGRTKLVYACLVAYKHRPITIEFQVGEDRLSLTSTRVAYRNYDGKFTEADWESSSRTAYSGHWIETLNFESLFKEEGKTQFRAYDRHGKPIDATFDFAGGAAPAKEVHRLCRS